MTEETFLDDVRRDARRGPSCSVSALLASLESSNASLREQVQRALDDPNTYQSTSISRELKKRGHDISDFAVSRHRRGSCACNKERA